MAEFAADGLHECDYLAANPLDPDRVLPGVPREQVDIPKAAAACRRAMAERPEVARFPYQLARVLFYGGETAEALANFQKAAGMGYRQAKFMIGLLMTRRYPGVPQDECRVAQLWLEAARMGHPNAQVSYVRDALKGRFKGCPGAATREEMLSFLDSAAGKVDYLGGLLIADLKDMLKGSR